MNEKPAIPSLVLIPGKSPDDYATIFSIASAYAYSGLLISEEGKQINHPELSFPAVVCSSFAIELFLKFFITLEISEGSKVSKKRVHLLEDLWNQITDRRKAIIAGMFRNNSINPAEDATDRRIEIFLTALNSIGSESAPFVKWRYIHELKDMTIMSHAAIDEISSALNRAASYCLSENSLSKNRKSIENKDSAKENLTGEPDPSISKWDDPKRLIRRTAGNFTLVQGHEPILLNRDSPLRRIPANLEPKLTIFLDGLRYTVEFLDIAYGRIYETLTQMALHTSSVEIPSHFANVFMDAWAFVYSVNRFRTMYMQMPGIKFDDPKPGIPTFNEITQDFRKLRRTADNLVSASDSIVETEGSALGELNWLTGVELEPELAAWHCTMRPGTLHKEPSQSHAPFSSTMGWPTDGIRLALGENEANLSAVRHHIALRIRNLELQLDNAFTKQEQFGVPVFNDFFAKRSVTTMKPE